MGTLYNAIGSSPLPGSDTPVAGSLLELANVLVLVIILVILSRFGRDGG